MSGGNDKDFTLELLRDLTSAAGVPGFEREARQVMERYLAPLAEVTRDRLGSVIARKGGAADSPRIMLAGHLDEVGFLVSLITDDGFLRFQPLGGWWDQVLLAQRVVVKTRQGDVPGVIGSKPPHVMSAEDRKKPVEKKDMFIDVGAASKEEALAMGIRPGDPIVPYSEFSLMKNEKLIMAKALDNRVGCALAVEVLRRLQDVAHPNTVYGVGTVQEEVGLRGAQTSAHAIEPDVGIALEVSIAGDVPGMKPEEAQSKLGQGPTVLLYDATLVPNVQLRDLIIDVAEDEGIPLQFDVMPGGGTDAGRIHLFGQGVAAICIGVPTRYIHSHVGILHRDDFEAAARLVTALVQRLDHDTVRALYD
ncbi:MAG: M42 family metallopeptidase [Limnochordales bacterium]|nr:M42 family metallopeptidase [Limnochordales bacterium]